MACSLSLGMNKIYYYILWLVFMWSLAIWSLNGDYIAGTIFLYKIVPSVNLQKIHQINIKCIVCNKNNKLMFNLSVENTFVVFGRECSSKLVKYPCTKITHVFFTDWTLICYCYIQNLLAKIPLSCKHGSERCIIAGLSN